MTGRSVDLGALKRAVAKSTKDSARLERRVVPEGYVRSARVEQVLKVRGKRS